MYTSIIAQVSNSNPLFNNVIVPAIVSTLTTVVLYIVGTFIWWLKKRFETKQESKKEIISKEKEVFIKMLDNHSRQFISLNIIHSKIKHEYEDTIAVAKELLVWSSDDVLSEYALYMENLSPKAISKLEEREIHFGKSILAFRKQLGYKNKNISPEQVAIIFKAVWGAGSI